MYCTVEQLNRILKEILSKIHEENQYQMWFISRYLQFQIEQESDNSTKNSLLLMSKICSCSLDVSSRDVFKPLIESNEQYSFVPSNLTLLDIKYLSEIVNDIDLPQLKARVADMLWLYAKPRDINHLKIAIQHYIDIPLSKNIFQIDIYVFWHRATSLAKSTKQQDKIDDIKNKLIQEIENPTSDWNFHKLEISKIFMETELDKNIFEYLADKLILEQQKFNIQNNFNIIEQYLNTAIILLNKAKLKDKEMDTIFLLAKTMEKYGDLKSNDSNIVANYFYKMALQIYRKVPSQYRSQYKIESLLSCIENKITNSGKMIIDEMKTSEISIDISEIQKKCIERVQDKKSLPETLLYFSGIYHADYIKILKKTENITKSSILSYVAPNISISNDGRQTNEIPVLTEHNQGEIIFKKAIQNFPSTMGLVVQGCILPALNQIQKEWIIPKNFLISLCASSSIVPEDRVILTANALYFGFERDFSTAIHLLSPQVENIVRQLFKKQGITTTTIDTQGVENEIGLSSLLDKEKAKEVLGDDLWFELQAVFTNSLSSNLRNTVAHGLLNDESSNSVESIYAWWFVFKWIIRSIPIE